MKKKLLSVLLTLTLASTMILGTCATVFAADMVNPLMMKVQTNEKASNVRAYSSSYKNNSFVCLRDIAAALNGSEKQFNVTYDKGKKAINLMKGQEYVPVGTEGQSGNREVQYASSAVTPLYVDGKLVKYTTYTVNGNLYIKLSDAAQLFDLNAQIKNDTLVIDTAKSFEVDINALDQSGYFSFLNGSLVGNATTGAILYSNKADNKVAIASTTKVMTYLLVKEAIDAKKIAWDDEVTLSKNVEAEASSEDGVVPMKAGQKVKVSELAEGMLIVSSNECATALAEHVAGSEAAFVKMMNDRARDLNLTSAEFYNPHGLPNFTADVLTAKRQNRMSAKDLFELARYTINKYPEVMEISSKQEANLETLDYTGSNTNRLLFNATDIDGLKTGGTNRAGSCLIVTKEVPHGDKTERIISVILGAEATAECAEKSAALIQYGTQYYAGN